MQTIQPREVGPAGALVALLAAEGKRPTRTELEEMARDGAVHVDILQAIADGRLVLAGYERPSRADDLGRPWGQLSDTTRREFSNTPALYDYYLANKDQIDGYAVD